MSGSLLRNIIFLFTVNLVIKPLWTFGIDIPSQNYFGHEVFGFYASLLSLSIMFQIMLDMGLQSYQSRQVGSNASSISWLLPNALLAKGIFSVGYLIVLMLLGWLIFDYDTYGLKLLVLLGISQIFNSLMLFLRSSVASLHYYAIDSIISIIDKAVLIIICGGLLYNYLNIPFKIEHLIYGQMIGYFISGLVAFIFVLTRTKIHWHNTNKKIIQRVIKRSLPFASLILVMSVFFRIDIIILEFLSRDTRPDEAGHYWSLYRLLDMMNNFTGILFAGLYLPMVMRFKKSKADLNAITKTGLSVLLPISISVCVLTYYYHNEVMQILYHQNSSSKNISLFFMMLSFPFYSLNYIYSTFLTGMGEIKRLTIHSMICAIVIIIMNLLFIKNYGSYALVLSSFIGHGIFFAMNYSLTQKKYQVGEINLPMVLKLAVFCLLTTTLGYLCKIYGEINLFIIIGIFILSSIIFLFLLRIINLKQLIEMIKARD